MECSCGGETVPSSHTVKTLKKALEWIPEKNPEVSLPVKVDSDTCRGCGRMAALITDSAGHVWRRG